MNIAIPKNGAQPNSHLRDPLFANTYFLVANILLPTCAGFFFWMRAAKLYPEDVDLTAARITDDMLVASGWGLPERSAACLRAVVNGCGRRIDVCRPGGCVRSCGVPLALACSLAREEVAG